MARGDQLYVYRPFFQIEGVYEHHGIDCGDGTVIHYRKPSEIIERTSLETFTWGNPIYKRDYPLGFCFIPDLVIQRAESRLGERKYNLLFNNCEHFATWCKTGMSASKQIQEFIPAIARLDPQTLSDPLKQALKEADPQNARRLLNEALGDIKEAWDDVQPQYKDALKEKDIWQRVAMEAVKQNRDDLARKALGRKLSYQKRATALEANLKQLATMTEKVLADLIKSEKLTRQG